MVGVVVVYLFVCSHWAVIVIGNFIRMSIRRRTADEPR